MAFGAHLRKARRHLARAARNAGVIKQDNFPVAGQAVGDGRIPIIHRPAKMLIEDQRHAASLAEPAIGEAYVIDLDDLRGSGLMRVGGHGQGL